MENVKLLFLLVAGYLLSSQVAARPEGPPLESRFEPCTNMEPIHGNFLPQQDSPVPVQVEGIPQSTPYSPMSTLEFTLSSTEHTFRGFMIQARASRDGEPLGAFTLIEDDKQQTLTCSAESDTLSHRNRNDTMSVSIRWSADAIDTSIRSFNFYYSIVQNFSTFWVMIPSPAITVLHPVAPGDINYQLVKAHGSVMIIAWALFAPVGILLALFYKVVWPNGEWFYTHIAIMIATLLLTLAGIVIIVVHAKGLWLSTTDANLPHQILGIIVVVAVAINPFMAICRCDPQSPFRPFFNWTHGLTGLVFGQGLALAAMMLGLNVFKDLPGVYRDRVHYAIYVMSGVIGIIIMILCSYNLYSIMFRKFFPHELEPDTLATTSEPTLGSIPDKPFQFHKPASEHDDEEIIEPSRDYLLRAGLGVAIIVVYLLLTVASIVLVALA